MSVQDTLSQIIVEILHSIAIHTSQVSVTTVAGRNTLVFEIDCHGDDMDRLIGRQGRTICAMETLIQVANLRATKLCPDELYRKRLLIEMYPLSSTVVGGGIGHLS